MVKGKYPKPFLSAWDRFRREKGTESSRPGTYDGSAASSCHMLLTSGSVRIKDPHFLVSSIQ